MGGGGSISYVPRIRRCSLHSQNARPVLDKVGSFQALISVETLGDYGVIRSAERDRQGKVMELYEAWHLSLFRYLRTLGLHRERAEDVVQETFLRLTGHLARGGAETNLRSWIFQVAFNLTMDGHRVDRRERVQSDGPEFIPDRTRRSSCRPGTDLSGERSNGASGSRSDKADDAAAEWGASAGAGVAIHGDRLNAGSQ